LAATLGLAVAQETSESLVVSRDARLAGQELARGNYVVKFEAGKDGELLVLKGKKEMFKAPYKLMKLAERAPGTAVIYKAGSNGSYLISRLEFKGSDVAVVFE
jgi:hypothetical protein